MLVSKLRFKREDGTDYPEWEEKKIGDILTLCHGKDYKHLENGDIPVMGTGGVITYVNEALCDWECVCIGRKGTIDKPYYMDKPFWSVDTLFYSKPLGNNMPKFQYYLFQNINWYFYNEASGVPSLSASTIENIKSKMPCLEEQQKIADFLSTVDEVITQSEAEVQNLEQQKKAAVQKTFSQEVRFKREDGSEYPEWEEKRVGEICSVSTGKSNTQDKIDNGQYPFYVRSPIIEHSDKYLYDEEAVITVGDGVGTGKVYHYVNGKYNLHQRCYRMYDFVNITAKYFFYVFSSHFYKRIKSMSAKTSVDSVRMDMITDMKILLPCLEEQQKIADFLSAYDEAISYAKQELEHWKQLKKGLLQQMFV